jgi:hypothetical protein
VSDIEGTPGSCGKQGILLSALAVLNISNAEASMKIVGLDCATVDAKVGLALGVLGEGGLAIQDATLCTRERAAATIMAGWVRDAQDAVLIAIDAPLGWPKPLGEVLINHHARGIGVPSTVRRVPRTASAA